MFNSVYVAQIMNLYIVNTAICYKPHYNVLCTRTRTDSHITVKVYYRKKKPCKIGKIKAKDLRGIDPWSSKTEVKLWSQSLCCTF